MLPRSKLACGFLGVTLLVACGRVDDDGGDGSNGGRVGSGGESSKGGSGGSGAVGQGGSGAVGQGGKTGAGGSFGKGGTTGAGGSGGLNTGGTVVWGGSAGEAGSGGSGGGGAAIVESSWDAQLALTVTQMNATAPVKCSKANFTMHLTPTKSGLDMISGRDGDVFTGQLVPSGSNGGYPVFGLKDSLQLSTRGGDCTFTNVTVTQLALEAWDDDGNATADAILGEGKATGQFIQGDIGVTVQLSFVLKSVPDVTKPSLVAPSASLHPLDGVTLRATEPVAVSSAVSLKSGAEGFALTGFKPDDGALGIFSSARILPFGSSWSVSATGTDLAALPFNLVPPPTVQVLADPGLFAQDGFETTPAVTLVGSAQIVSAIGNLPAINGAHSLLVPPNASATLHLARPSTASSVRFTAQTLTSVSGFSGGTLPVTVGVVGGIQKVSAGQASSTTTPTPTGDSTWAYAGAKQDVSLTLTESGPDVVVRIAPQVCFGLCPPSQAILIDDLRVE